MIEHFTPLTRYISLDYTREWFITNNQRATMIEHFTPLTRYISLGYHREWFITSVHWLSNGNSKGLSGCGRYNNGPFTHSIASVVARALGMHLLQVRFTSSLLASITPELDDTTTLHGCGHPSLPYCTGGHSNSYSRTVTPVLYWWSLPYGMLLLSVPYWMRPFL